MTTAAPTSSSSAEKLNTQSDSTVPVWQRDPNASQMTEAERDYLFDLRGFDIIENALSPEQLKDINDWVDQYDIASLKTGQWLGHVETHKYGSQSPDGINFQNIIEGGPVFEQCIDNPAYIDRLRRYIEVEAHFISLDENFLNIRQSGGFIPIHSGGSHVRFTSSFRNHAGKWMVGQINVLMALTDIGLGDGCTTVVPGSHKAHMDHPADAAGDAWGKGKSGGDAAGMVQIHLKAGEAVMFTDAITHGSIPRTNPGQRRVMIYRYAPHLLANRYNYLPSEELLARLNPKARALVQSQPPRFHPDRKISFTPDNGPTDFQGVRD